MIVDSLKVSRTDFTVNFVPLLPKNALLPPNFINAFEAVQTFANHCLAKGLYLSFVECAVKANMCPGLQFFLTPTRVYEGEESLGKVDIGVYTNADAPNDGKLHCENQRMWVEFIWDRDRCDPFDDNRPEFEATSPKQQKARRHLISYATKVFAHQHKISFHDHDHA
ncbi:hypothetical protein AcW1_009431 [Taiwanofungus camphoratus]|nr:hypothetical protein AcW1_009431 [Antrodia cinnamomea]